MKEVKDADPVRSKVQTWTVAFSVGSKTSKVPSREEKVLPPTSFQHAERFALRLKTARSQR